jgi:hypothetical protein
MASFVFGGRGSAMAEVARNAIAAKKYKGIRWVMIEFAVD